MTSGPTVRSPLPVFSAAAFHTQANGTNLVNNYLAGTDPASSVKDANVAKNASVNNNKVNSIGIKGTDIVFNEFAAAEAGTPSIHTEVDGVRFVATSVGGDGSSSSVTGNDITSVAIDGTNVTFNRQIPGTSRWCDFRYRSWRIRRQQPYVERKLLQFVWDPGFRQPHCKQQFRWSYHAEG